MYIYIYIYREREIHTCICMYYVYIYIYIYVRVYVYIYIYIYMHTCIHAPIRIHYIYATGGRPSPEHVLAGRLLGRATAASLSSLLLSLLV